jgi:hypothetical protein
MNTADALFGLDMFGNPIRPPSTGPVADRFTFAPFTVLDAKTGAWRDRKRAWMAMGIAGELGRDAKSYNIHEWADANAGGAKAAGGGVSVFDPVLCEIAYRWFSPAGGQVVDPFAGGSVRGIVAGATGRRYWGADLRPEQIEANREQAAEIPTTPAPVWVCGDSRDALAYAPEADFVFSCPPYGDLERYSDDPTDLSAMDWPAFCTAYREIIAGAVSRLRPNRFACFVVGDFRDRKGLYRGFVPETVAAFEAAGAMLYNEAVLLTPTGSAAMRVSRQFAAGRKLCKVHQNVLVFVKGDPMKAAKACGPL